MQLLVLLRHPKTKYQQIFPDTMAAFFELEGAGKINCQIKDVTSENNSTTFPLLPFSFSLQ